MDTLLQDLRYALRQLRARPGFTVIVVATLALGVGANSAVFTVLYRALLRTLPVADPGRLVHVVTDRGPAGINYNLSYPAVQALRTDAAAFSGVAARTSLSLALSLPDAAERLDAGAVTHGFFAVLGARLALGREFTLDEARPGGPATVVLGHALWQRRFGARPDVLGRPVILNGQPFTVIGVAAPSFRGPVAGRTEDLWVPIGSMSLLTEWGDLINRPTVSWLDVMARLAPGWSLAQAQAAMELLDAQAVRAGQRPDSVRTLLLEGSRGLTFAVSGLTKPLVALMLVVGLVLVLACANVANLLLAKADARRREVAIRVALGSSRMRLVRQLLTESVVLAVLGGAAGLLVARWGVDVLLSYTPALAIERRVDAGVIGFTLAAAILTGVAFGLAPALRASRPEVVSALKGGAVAWHERLFGLRGALVVLQVAISFVLVIGAGLFLRSIANLQAVDLGYTPGNVLLASLDLEQAGYDRPRGTALIRQVLDRLAATPGIDVASAAQVITPNPAGGNWSGIGLEGYVPAPDEEVSFDVNRVAPGYFKAMGIALLRGREFDARDATGAPVVAIVNESFQRRYYPTQGALGRHLLLGDSLRPQAVEIVGVARDGKYRDVRESGRANVYFPLLQSYRSDATLVLRTREAPLRMAAAVRREVQSLDPRLPLFDVRTLSDHVAAATARERMIATLSGAFGVVALLLAAVGVFGVLAYAVSRRTREIGVRVALGARPADVVRMVMKGGALLAGLGLAVGFVGALLLGRFAAGLLFGVTPTDPVVTAAALAVLGAAAALASWLPARRAARVDPMEALRTE